MNTANKNEKYIFASYAHKDRETVLPIIGALQREGFHVWFDRDIMVGSEWPEHIEEKVVQCETMLVFMSPFVVDSQNCRNEINLAFNMKKNILVIFLEKTELRRGLALQLGTSQSISLYEEPSKEIFYKRLLNASVLQSCRMEKDETKIDETDGTSIDEEKSAKDTEGADKRRQAAYEAYLEQYPILKRAEELKRWHEFSHMGSRLDTFIEFGVMVFFLLVCLLPIYPSYMFITQDEFSTLLGVIILIVSVTLSFLFIGFLVKRTFSHIRSRRVAKIMKEDYEELMAVPPFVWEDEQA